MRVIWITFSSGLTGQAQDSGLVYIKYSLTYSSHEKLINNNYYYIARPRSDQHPKYNYSSEC